MICLKRNVNYVTIYTIFVGGLNEGINERIFNVDRIYIEKYQNWTPNEHTQHKSSTLVRTMLQYNVRCAMCATSFHFVHCILVRSIAVVREDQKIEKNSNTSLDFTSS